MVHCCDHDGLLPGRHVRGASRRDGGLRGAGRRGALHVRWRGARLQPLRAPAAAPPPSLHGAGVAPRPALLVLIRGAARLQERVL